MHCKDLCPPLQKWCVPFAYSVTCASKLQVVFASTLLVVCSVYACVVGEGGTCSIVIQRSDQCCVSLFAGHAGGHSSLYGAFLAFA